MPDEGPPKDEGENIIRMAPRGKRKAWKPTLVELGRRLRSEPLLGEGKMFRLDTFSNEVLVMMRISRPGVEPPQEVFKPHTLTDNNIGAVCEIIETLDVSGKVSDTQVHRAILLEAERNKFSAARAALDRLPTWDGVVRLDKFWIDVCGAEVHEEGASEEENWRRQRYLASTARAFFIGIVARILVPGEKVDHMPVLEGPQGTLKSSLLKVIALEKRWFSDSMPTDLGSKDARMHLMGKLIIELAELSQLGRTKVEAMKAFLTTTDDKYRPPFGRRDAAFPRQCVFVGTTNSPSYFSDDTGNRRFWPIKCGRIDLAKAKDQMQQLYAEALQAHRDEEDWWLKGDVEVIASDEQRARLTNDAWEGVVRELIKVKKNAARNNSELWAWVTTAEALTEVTTEKIQWTNGAMQRVGVILTKLGGTHTMMPRNIDGDRKRGYRFDLVPG